MAHGHADEGDHLQHEHDARAGGSAIARLLADSREQVAEFDASTEEVIVMTRGLVPAAGAGGPEWDHALAGHSAAERQTARVYTLDV